MKPNGLRAVEASLVLVLPGAGRASDWPGWRGPGGAGFTDERALPLTWDARTGENVRWKVSLAVPPENLVLLTPQRFMTTHDVGL